MKLINANKLKIDLQENFCKYTITCDECSKMFGEELCDIIDKQTTAYDVDKVVAELKSHSNNEKMATSKLFDGKHRYYRAISVTKAINIVKRGGVDG